MTQICLCKCLLGLATPLSPLLSLSPEHYQRAHSTKLPHYLLLGSENLFSTPCSYYDEDNKGAYQQFLPMERSFFFKDDIKGTTLISGEHVKPCNKPIGSV